MVQSLILNAKIWSKICYHSTYIVHCYQYHSTDIVIIPLILYSFKIVFCQAVKWKTDMGFGLVAKLERRRKLKKFTNGIVQTWNLLKYEIYQAAFIWSDAQLLIFILKLSLLLKIALVGIGSKGPCTLYFHWGLCKNNLSCWTINPCLQVLQYFILHEKKRTKLLLYPSKPEKVHINVKSPNMKLKQKQMKIAAAISSIFHVGPDQ